MPTACSPHQAYNAVKSAVDRVDPIGLLACGAPSDEYTPEINDITNLVMTDTLTTKTVQAVFWYWFEMHVSDADLQQIVHIINQQIGGA